MLQCEECLPAPHCKTLVPQPAPPHHVEPGTAASGWQSNLWDPLLAGAALLRFHMLCLAINSGAINATVYSGAIIEHVDTPTSMVKAELKGCYGMAI